jgi:hypothetical protein
MQVRVPRRLERRELARRQPGAPSTRRRIGQRFHLRPRRQVAFLFQDSLEKGGYLQTAGEEGTIRLLWSPRELRAKIMGIEGKGKGFAGLVCVELSETTATREAQLLALGGHIDALDAKEDL